MRLEKQRYITAINGLLTFASVSLELVYTECRMCMQQLLDSAEHLFFFFSFATHCVRHEVKAQRFEIAARHRYYDSENARVDEVKGGRISQGPALHAGFRVHLFCPVSPSQLATRSVSILFLFFLSFLFFSVRGDASHALFRRI